LQRPASLKDAIEVHWQQEKGGKTGRLHLQGYVRFRFPKSRAQLQEMLPGWWHIRHGSHQQAINYCTKDATRVSGPYKFESEHFEPYTPSAAERNAIDHYSKKD
jgi:hypothetical protein